MQRQTVETLVTAALEGRELLGHDFYIRWARGELEASELRSYAGQYRHYERALPGLLMDILAHAPAEPIASLVRRNLADEQGEGGVSHLELFDDFAAGVGAPRDAAATPATVSLVETYARLCSGGAVSGLGALVAYETQAPGIAASKATGLRRHHGLEGPELAFWDLHAEADVDHAAWSTEALARAADDAAEVSASVRAAADAWWAFLDERALARPGADAFANRRG